MCRIKVIERRLILLLIAIIYLSGCGQDDGIPVQTIPRDHTEAEPSQQDVSNGNSGFAPTERDEQSTDLPKPLDIPVNTRTEDVHYRSEDDIDLLRAMRRCRSDGENIYLAYGEQDLYYMPIGTDGHSRMNIENPEGLDVCNIAMDIYGRIHLLMSLEGDQWFIRRLDESGKIDKEIDISAYFDTKNMPGWFLIDKAGRYYLQWSVNRDGMIIDGEGALMHRFTPKSLGVKWIYQAAVGKDGGIYLIHGYMDEKLEISQLDVESCTIMKEDSPLCFSGDETFSAMSGGTDTNLLLFSPYSGVWACDPESEILDNRVPISDIGFDSDTEFWPLTFLADGRLLLLGKTGDDIWLKYLPSGQ